MSEVTRDCLTWLELALDRWNAHRPHALNTG